MESLEDLVAAAIEERRGDCLQKRAFTELVKRYQDMVFGLAYAILQDHFLAQDAAQETFIIAYRKLESLIHPEAFPRWLQQIARRETLKALKRRRGSVVPPEAAAGQAAADAPPEQVYERKESRRQIQASLNRLPEGQRIPVVLYYIDGYSQQQIAGFLELKTNTVKKRIQRGRESMQRDLMGTFERSLKSIRPSKDDRLLRAINIYTTFDTAAKTGQMELLEQMLVDGVEIDGRDAEGKTLLHWAVENDHADAVRLLLKYGADRDVVDRSGKTAYQLARKRKNAALLRLFELEQGR
jgi:RNA polymerase sigma factor (sigma-70 family)